MDVLVTYDISTIEPAGERRLARVAAVCERYGVRAQYSVFECRLDDILLQRFISELESEIEPRQDSINLYKLNGTFDAVRQSLGSSGLDWERSWVL